MIEATQSAPPVGTLPSMDVGARLGRLRALFEGAQCDALLVTSLTNIQYLTGFTGSAATLLVTEDGALFVTDGRYLTQCAEQLDAAGVVAERFVGRVPEQLDALGTRVNNHGVGRLGLEASDVTWAFEQELDQRFGSQTLVATRDLVESLRIVKDSGEVARIEQASAIADAALANTLPLLLDAPTEAEFGLALDFEMRRLGAADVSFETIVATGPNGAKPHARPSERRVQHGELIVLDFGAVVDGYHSDMTRTVCVGEPRDPVLRRMVEAVSASQAAGVDAVCAGAEAKAVDAACRGVIEGYGWADAFLHGTGHGVGLQIHEAPGINSQSVATLAAGHVVTVEPGVYLPDHGGVRIEDTVVVTPAGSRTLTHAPKELIVS